MTFLDVGANAGQTIDYIRLQFPNVIIHSFEPTPDVFSRLEDKYGSLSNVFLYEIALADKDGKLNFYASNFSPTNSCLEPNQAVYEKLGGDVKDMISNVVSYEVDAVRLDNWYSANIEGKEIDVIKIDTQGFEHNVIKGGLETLRNHCKIVFFEAHYFDFYHGETPFYKTFELLYENGFYLYCLMPCEKKDKFQWVESDVVFLNDRFFPR